jgi:PAS domain S-box-containing protein
VRNRELPSLYLFRILSTPGVIALTAIAGGLGGFSSYGETVHHNFLSTLTSGLLLGLATFGLVARIAARRLSAPAGGGTELDAALRETARERDELAEEYRQLTKNLPAAVTVRDPKGKISFCSPYTEVLTGYALTEILAADGDFFLSIIHEEDREKYLHALKYGSEGERFNYRYRIVHRSGIELWVETRTHPIFNEQGDLTALLSITLDVDLTVRYQRQVELKNSELQEVTYMVSHDLKAPIVTLKGMVDILEQDFRGKFGSEGDEVLGHIKGAALRLDQLVHSVLEYARVGNDEVRQENIPLPSLFAEILQDLRTQIDEAKASVTVAPDLGSDVTPILVQGDRVKLYRVFSNLLSNSLKYRDITRPCEIRIDGVAQRGNRYFQIVIVDNGMGIPPTKLPSILRPFQRARTSRPDGTVIEGSGIGLASVKKLLDRMGGEVQIESSEGVGTTVRVLLRRSFEE